MHLRTSSQGVSPQIEILQSERIMSINQNIDYTLLNTPVTQSTLFKTFTEMPKAKAFSKSILRIPSPRARLMMQLTHNKVQREQIISQMTERHQEVISDALDQGTQKKLKIRVVQKLKRRENSPKKKVNLKEGARVYQMPNLALPTVEAEIDHPPQLTFYGETQEFFRSVRSFRPSFTESGSMALYGDSLYLYGGIAGDGIRDQMLRFDLRFQDWHVVSGLGEMPKNGRASLTVVALRNHFIYFGGSCKFNTKLKVRECFNTVFDYNASTRFWEKANVQGDYIEPRRHHKACLYGWKWMLVYGGVNSSEQVLNDTALYNIEKMIWKQWDVKSTPICCHSIINISQSSKFNDNTTDLIPAENIYSFGGKNQDGNSTNLMKKLIFYPNTTTPIAWETIQSEGKPPMPCHNHTMEFIKKLQGIIILGGQRDQIINGCLESSECFIFYTSLNLWQQVLIEGMLKLYKCSHRRYSLKVCRKRIILILIINNEYFIQIKHTYFQIYIFHISFFKVLNRRIIPRCAHNSLLLSSKIAVFGGIGNGRYLEPLINYIETDQTQVQARVTKEQFTKRQNQYLQQSQKNSLEKLELLTYSPRQFTSFHSESNKGQVFRINTKRLSCLPQSTRSYLPQKRQVLVRYDILIGFVKQIIKENLDILNNFEKFMNQQSLQ